MANTSTQQLALFGKNRYHDWVMLFFITVAILVVIIAYNTILYLNVRSLVTETSEHIATVPSKFEDFKKDVETINVFITSKRNGIVVNVPQDPSQR